MLKENPIFEILLINENNAIEKLFSEFKKTKNKLSKIKKYINK